MNYPKENYQSPLHPYFLRDGFVFKARCSEAICSSVTVSKKIVHLERDEELLELTLLSTDGHKKTIIISRGDLTQKRFDSLAAKGVDIHDKNYERVLEYLLHAEKKAPIEYLHRKMGWCVMEDGSWAYKHDQLIGNAPPSRFELENVLKPAGTLSAWTRMVQEQVQGQTALELILAAGFASMLIPRLHTVSSYRAFMLHLAGDSSTGKTTALRLALSAFANPNSREFFKSWTATQNALFASFDGNFGLPIVVDESSAVPTHDLTNFIYTFSEGSGKERAKPDGSLRPAPSWSTLLLSSGEARLPKNHNNGLQIRLLELCDMPFTSSANNANSIINVIKENYGHAATTLAEYLVKTPQRDLDLHFESCKKSLLDEMNHDRFVGRTVDRVATIVLAVRYANHALGLKLDEAGIVKLLLKLDKEQRQDIGQAALETLKEYVASHSNSFSHSNQFYGNTIGTYNESGHQAEIVVVKSELKKILGQAGFLNLAVVLGRWKASGLLNCEADRYTRTRKIGLVKVEAVVVRYLI